MGQNNKLIFDWDFVDASLCPANKKCSEVNGFHNHRTVL